MQNLQLTERFQNVEARCKALQQSLLTQAGDLCFDSHAWKFCIVVSAGHWHTGKSGYQELSEPQIQQVSAPDKQVITVCKHKRTKLKVTKLSSAIPCAGCATLYAHIIEHV